MCYMANVTLDRAHVCLSIQSYLLSNTGLTILLQFRLMQLPQLVDARNMPRHSPAGNLNTSRNRISLLKRVGGSRGGDLDNPDARIICAPIMDAVTKVPNPGFQLR